MRENPYQPLITLLSNILEAYTTAFFITDMKKRRLDMVALQTLSNHVTEGVSLPIENSGILAQVQKIGQTIHLDKVPDLPKPFSSTIPFYRDEESHIKGLLATQVADGDGVLYVDTKYSWGFNDKQQKLIHEFAGILGDLMERDCSMVRQQECAEVLELWARIDAAAFEGQTIQDFGKLFVTECSDFLGAEYGFVASRLSGEDEYRIIASTDGVPKNLYGQAYLLKHGLMGRTLGSCKPLFIGRLNPSSVEHYIFSSAEGLPHAGTLWIIPVQLTLGHTIAAAFLSREPVEWNVEQQQSITHLMNFLHLLFEQLYFKEECDGLRSYDLSTGLLNDLMFELRVDRLVGSSMQASTPFTLALIQFEPWQVLSTLAPPREMRKWQSELALAVRESVPPNVVCGQISQNRIALLFAGLTPAEARYHLTPMSDLPQRVLGGKARKYTVHSYMGAAGFPQDGTRADELWTAACKRLFSTFRAKGERICT